MKRIFTFGLMLTAVFAFTNCTEEIVDPTIPTDEVTQEGITDDRGIPFTVCAPIASETKTQAHMDGTSLKTKWSEGDKISVYYAEVASIDENGTETLGTRFKYAGEFEIDETKINEGVFKGFLPDGFDTALTYNWYFVYGAVASDESNKTATVKIGTATIKAALGAYNHTAGLVCPMYGTAKKLSGTVTPTVRMSHLANLIEMKIENRTNKNNLSGALAGDVVINNVGISYSTTGSWAKTEALMGSFTLDILTGELTKTSTVTNSMSYTLTSPVTLSSIYDDKGTNPTAATFYFVTAPMDLQTAPTISSYYLISDKKNTITVDAYNALSKSDKAKYLPDIIRQDTFSITVNGSVRPAPESTYPEAEGDEFRSGNLQKITVPIRELQNPFQSDGFNITSKGAKSDDSTIQVLSMENYEKVSYTINGYTCDEVYVLGKTGKATYITNEDGNIILDPDDETNKACQASITIRGFLKDMLDGLPIGFYATRYNDLPTAMTIDKIDFKLPKYKGTNLWVYSWYEFDTIESRSLFSAKYGTVFESLGMDLTNGITREFIVNTLNVDPKTITFSGLTGDGFTDSDPNNKTSFVLYEAPVYKHMSDAADGNIQSYISKFNYGSYKATLDGLKDIVDPNNTYYSKGNYQDKTINWTAAAEETGNAIYNRIFYLLLEKGKKFSSLVTKDTLKLALAVFELNNVDCLMHFMRDMEIEIIIKTYPHPNNPDTFNPLVIWGMDAKGSTIVQSPTIG